MGEQENVLKEPKNKLKCTKGTKPKPLMLQHNNIIFVYAGGTKT